MEEETEKTISTEMAVSRIMKRFLSVGRRDRLF